MSEPNVPADAASNEHARELKTDILNNAQGFVDRLAVVASRGYPDIKRLLSKERRFTEKELRENRSEVGAAKSNYRFIRRTPSYIGLRIERDPRDPNSDDLPDVVEIIIGNETTSSYAYTMKKVASVTASSEVQGQEPYARSMVDAFIGDIEAQF